MCTVYLCRINQEASDCTVSYLVQSVWCNAQRVEFKPKEETFSFPIFFVSNFPAEKIYFIIYRNNAIWLVAGLFVGQVFGIKVVNHALSWSGNELRDAPNSLKDAVPGHLRSLNAFGRVLGSGEASPTI